MRDGVVVTSVARTLVDLARTESLETAVIAADDALRRRLVKPDELADMLEQCEGMSGARQARRSLCLANGRSESPGETRTRLYLRHLAVLDCQVEIRDTGGRFLARADLGCDEAATLIEYDGFVKYGALLKPGQRPEEVVFQEKRREDTVREQGHLVARVVDADFHDLPRLIDRISRTMARGRALVKSGRGPVGTYQPWPRIGL